MSARLGPSTEAEVLELIGPAEDAALVAEGVLHATRKISDDAYRLVGRAHGWFHDPAISDTAKRAVRYAPDNLRVLAWAAARDANLAARLRPRGRNGSDDATLLAPQSPSEREPRRNGASPLHNPFAPPTQPG